MCYATVDTDAVGSTRLPAACCGVVGYKCTWGRLDNTGVLAGEKADPIILKLATVGIMARDVVDVALVADALADTTYAKDLKKTDASQHVGIVTNFGADEPIRKHFDAALSVVEKLGYTTTNTAAPIVENPDMGHMDEVRKTVNVDVFKDVEVLMLPTTATTVLKAKDVGENPQALSPQNTFFANYYGLPAISVPCGFDDDGLPIGIQFVGKLDDDVSVLRVALAYQNATDWSKKHPA
jgi:aspartyl-tRNA(Asn)/glutamyl-tRNA(Gln) amidotransferase subunit A